MLLSFLMAAQVPALAVSCSPAAGPALLVEVSGFKARQGQVRVRVFGGATSTYFDKKHWLSRIQVPVPTSGPVRFCMPVPRAGAYAVDVRHDTDNDGETDRGDGGGASGNPQLGLWDVLLGRKPDPRKVQVQVGNGVVAVPITLMYLQGGKFRPSR